VGRDWQALFNGRDLDGWQQLGGGRWAVRDGQLVLEHDDARRPGYLVHAVTARDFHARFRCRVECGDSGFFFRSRRHPRTPTEVTGPQVQLNVEPERGLGGLYELHGRGWLAKPPPALTAGLPSDSGWLACEVEARGDWVTVRVNGVETVRLHDGGADNLFRGPGAFALQIHGGGCCRVFFRDIAVLLLD
jgi:hypothetical protein